MPLIKYIKLIFILGVLFGCANNKVWVNPNKNSRQFDNEKYLCMQQNTGNVCRQFSGSNSQHCQPNALTGGVDCFGSSSPGGTSCQNETNWQMFNACMESKGWRLVDKQELADKQSNAQINSNRTQLIGESDAKTRCLNKGLIEGTYPYSVCFKELTGK
jgi:hypothetical protein